MLLSYFAIFDLGLGLSVTKFVAEAQVRVDLLRPRRKIAGKLAEVDAEDYVLVRLTMKNGVKVLCQADLITPVFTNLVEILGEIGTFMASIQPEMPSFIFCNQDAAGYQAGWTPLRFGKLNLFEAQMAEFVNAVRWQTEPTRCTLQDSLRLLETLELLKKSQGMRANAHESDCHC